MSAAPAGRGFPDPEKAAALVAATLVQADAGPSVRPSLGPSRTGPHCSPGLGGEGGPEVRAGPEGLGACGPGSRTCAFPRPLPGVPRPGRAVTATGGAGSGASRPGARSAAGRALRPLGRDARFRDATRHWLFFCLPVPCRPKLVTGARASLPARPRRLVLVRMGNRPIPEVRPRLDLRRPVLCSRASSPRPRSAADPSAS